MKRKMILGTASAMAVLFNAAPAFADDVKPELSETYALSDFDKISVVGVYHLDVQVGDSFSVETSGSKKDMAKIEVYVEDGVLVLGLKDRKKPKLRNGNNQGVNAVITLPALSGMEIAGVVTGGVSKIDVDSFDIDFAGVGELALAGSCLNLEVNMAGVGELDAEGLECEDVEVNLAGVGEASVYASQSIDASAAGMGQIDVYGSPKIIEKSSAFLAKVKIR